MNITKRDFIKIGAGAALTGMAFPSFAAKSKPAYGGRKVRIAAIGTGPRFSHTQRRAGD